MIERPSWGLVFIRVVIGFLLLIAGWGNLPKGEPASLFERGNQAFAASPEIVHRLSDNIVLKNPWFLERTVVIAEIVCGMLLFLGLLTRPAGFIAGALFTYGFFVVPESQRTLCIILAVCCFACGISRAGRRSGADVFLEDRLPSWLTWTRAPVAAEGD
ncbi:MAG: DoxX family protein [Planctomycetes bacterium]|nr:DoxX family protein [Planctomycetota bacterium]